jgi:hypothetical protein
LKTHGLISSLLLISIFAQACNAQAPVGMGGPAVGIYKNFAGAAGNEGQYITVDYDSNLLNERKLAVSGGLTLVDSGANAPITIGITNSLANGLTGATTAQGALNNVAGVSSTGDMLYYNGANWVHLAAGADGYFLTLAGGVPSWSAGTPGAGGGESFLVVNLSGALSGERAIAAGNGILGTDGGADGNYTLEVDDTVVLTLTGTQTATNKTLTSPKLTYHATDGLLLRNSAATADGKIVWADFGANRTLTIPDPGGNASFVMTAGNQTIAGTKTFSSAPVISQISNTGLLTLPTSADTLVGRATTDTLTNKLLSSAAFDTQITLNQTSGNYTITWNNPAANRGYRIQDMGTGADFLFKAQAESLTAGGVLYGDATKVRITAQGSSGQALISAGAGTPAFGTLGAGAGGTGTTSVPAKGTILVGNNAGTAYQVLAVGADGTFLKANSGVAGGVEWGTGGAGAGTVEEVQADDSGSSDLFTVTIGNDPTVNPNVVTTLTDPNDSANSYIWGHINGQGAGTVGYKTWTSFPVTEGHSELVLFGGNGTDGAESAFANETAENRTFNYSSVNVVGGNAHNVPGCYIFSQAEIFLDGNTMTGYRAAGRGQAGGAARPSASMIGVGAPHTSSSMDLNIYQIPQGPGGFGGSVTAAGAGGGGGASPVANGGAGGTGVGTGGYGGERVAVGASTMAAIKWGGGGGGGSTSTAGVSGSGGAGGGWIIFAACDEIEDSTASGATAITAAGNNGGNASAGSAGGGGGGGGGTLWFFSQQSVTLTERTTVVGGNGGNGLGSGFAGGGGGGGGLIFAHSPSNSIGSALVDGGSGGVATSGTANNGSDGSDGTATSVTGTPNAVNVAFAVDARGVFAQAKLLKTVAAMRGQDEKHFNLSQLRHSQWLAAWYAKPGKFNELCYALNYGGDVKEAIALSETQIEPVSMDESFMIQVERTAECDLVELLPAA